MGAGILAKLVAWWAKKQIAAWCKEHWRLLAILAAVVTVAVVLALTYRAGYNSATRAAVAREAALEKKAAAAALHSERSIVAGLGKIGSNLNITLTGLRLVNVASRESIREQVAVHPVYQSCRLTDGVRGQLEDMRARTDGGPPAGSGGKVPAPAPRSP